MVLVEGTKFIRFGPGHDFWGICFSDALQNRRFGGVPDELEGDCCVHPMRNLSTCLLLFVRGRNSSYSIIL